MDIKIRKLVFASLFTAITCVATMLIQIPTPIGGYVHAGDAFVVLGAMVLGGLWGSVAAGLGSALADIIFGFTVYAPGTFVIKFIVAVTVSAVFRALPIKKMFLRAFIASLVAEACMVALYFIYESTILGFGIAAVAEIIPNALQGLFGALVGSALIIALLRSDYVVKSFPELRKYRQ